MGGLASRIADLTGAGVLSLRPMSGGDLSSVSFVQLDDGRTLIAKQGSVVDREARMLRAMATAQAPVPEVLGQTGDLLLLEALTEERPDAGSWAAAGQALATLHAQEGEAYGWNEDYALGAVPVSNRWTSNWSTFWVETRLAVHLSQVPPEIARRIEALCLRLPDFLPASPRPSLLHGDLWSGNLLFGPALTVHFIDPACYYGDAEVDLAMLHLFGTPGAGFADTYGPLLPGWEIRRAIYTLWPALVHFRLFGSGYRGIVERCLDQTGS